MKKEDRIKQLDINCLLHDYIYNCKTINYIKKKYHIGEPLFKYILKKYLNFNALPNTFYLKQKIDIILIDKILHDYVYNCFNIKYIEKKYHIDRRKIKRILKQFDVPILSPKFFQNIKKRKNRLSKQILIVFYNKNNKTTKEIAKLTKKCESEIIQTLHYYNIPIKYKKISNAEKEIKEFIMKKLSTKEFIEKAKKIHGNKYDYSRVEYKNNKTKICIICNEHGEFRQTPDSHLNSNNSCPKCNKSHKLTTKEFIEKAKKIHGNKYDYSRVEYKNNKTKICIICNEHGEFQQTPNSHLNGSGCPKCASKKRAKSQSSNTCEFIKKAKQIHGDKYDYSQVDYKNANAKVCIICNEHGEFWQRPHEHINGNNGCPKCSGNMKLTTEEFIKKAKKTHGNKYNYSLVEYKNSHTKVRIICPEHGDFWQIPRNHLIGNSCPKCNKNYKLTTEEFIKKAKQVHGNKYNYSKVNYVNNTTKVCIICPEHGDFQQAPHNHLAGKNCPDCRSLKTSKPEKEIKKFIMKKLTTKEFIEKAKKIHGNKYDYSKVNYVNNTTKVCIICPEHGDFWQRPYSHLNNRSCPECGSKKRAKSRSSNTCEFIKKAKQIHGDKYDYSLVEYKNSQTKICIICPEHDKFWQRPYSHLNDSGCPKCGFKKRAKSKLSDTNKFINHAKQIHGDKYDYSLVDYKNSHKKIHIICPEHGEFWQRPYSHLNGDNCPKCGFKKRAKSKLSDTNKFINHAKQIHNNKYNYSKVDYKNNKSRICIICPDHGEFWQIPNDHLNGSGCPKCGSKKRAKSKLSDTHEFIEKAKQIHNNKYNYSKVDYKNNKSRICIICPDHGEFWQIPYTHLNNSGCPKCSNNISKPEKEINKFINTRNIEIITNSRKIISPYEIDIFLPEYNLAIEYDGVFWHSEQKGKNKNYHLKKTKACEKNGIQLLHIFENEWLDPIKRKIWQSVIMNKIGIYDKKIGARQTTLKPISSTTCNEFLSNNHLQGKCVASIRYGLFYNNELVSIMTFGKTRFSKKYDWELIRFCSKCGYQIYGAASKMLSHFKKEYKGTLISYANKRWSNGNLYEKIGFVYSHTSKPNYFYFKNNDITQLHSRNKFQKHKLHRKLDIFDPNKTEYENMLMNNYDRIWDCGNIIYILKI